MPSSSSQVWRRLKDCKDTLKRGACKLIGNGLGTKVWEEPWIPKNEDSNFLPIAATNITPSPNLFVANLNVELPQKMEHILSQLTLQSTDSGKHFKDKINSTRRARQIHTKENHVPSVNQVPIALDISLQSPCFI